MPLKDDLQSMVKKALLEKDSQKATLIRSVLAALKQIEVDQRRELSEEDENSVLQKELKKRNESLKFALEAKREDLIKDLQKEIDFIQSFFGAPLSKEEIEKIIKNIVKEGASNMGRVMSSLKREYAGRYDGKEASQIAKEVLSQT